MDQTVRTAARRDRPEGAAVTEPAPKLCAKPLVEGCLGEFPTPAGSAKVVETRSLGEHTPFGGERGEKERRGGP
jgi:hypothetical protein